MKSKQSCAGYMNGINSTNVSDVLIRILDFNLYPESEVGAKDYDIFHS